MKTDITPEFLQALVDFEACNDRVRSTLGALETDEDLLRFFCRYASWNGRFANGVSALTSLIGDQRVLFMEPGMPRAVADRSNFIAGHFFDAARDEYDDHINPNRDSHRCMAQASLLGMTEVLGLGTAILDEPEPPALEAINAAVRTGYTGGAVAQQSGAEPIFFGMGFHLGSELLADREFSIIDEHLRLRHAPLVGQLMRKTVKLAGGEHRCYAWVGVHSGHGGGVEADHFDHALAGVRAALGYLDPAHVPDAFESVQLGFRAFDAHHREFFSLPMRPA